MFGDDTLLKHLSTISEHQSQLNVSSAFDMVIREITKRTNLVCPLCHAVNTIRIVNRNEELTEIKMSCFGNSMQQNPKYFCLTI